MGASDAAECIGAALPCGGSPSLQLVLHSSELLLLLGLGDGLAMEAA